MILFLIGGLLLGGVAVAFALQNTTTVTITLFSWQVESSLSLIIILAIASGAVISTLLSLPGNIKKGFRIANLEKQNSKLEKELADKKGKVESGQPKTVTNSSYSGDLKNTPK